MNQKKSPQADLESKRPLFFLSGLSIVLLAVIFIIQIKTEVDIKAEPIPVTGFVESDPIPRTYPAIPEVPEKTYKASNDKINPEDEIIDVKPVLVTPTITTADTIVEIEDEPLVVEKVETISAILIQKLAVPMSCADIYEREAQMACLNDWVYKYINSNINLNKVRNPFGGESRVFVHFIISEHGEIEDVQIVRSAFQSLDEEIVRVVSGMPRFRPAGQMGRKAKMSMTIPVTIKMR